MTISNSRDVNCRANAPGLWPLTISLGANSSILLQLGGGLYSKADSDFGATLVRNPSERDAAEQKPTPIKPGYWRNKWFSDRGWAAIHPTNIRIDFYHQLSGIRYPSRELAEEYAARKMRDQFAAGKCWAGREGGVKYLGPVFFPEEGGAS